MELLQSGLGEQLLEQLRLLLGVAAVAVVGGGDGRQGQHPFAESAEGEGISLSMESRRQVLCDVCKSSIK